MDDHEFFRRGLRELLRDEGFDVVAEASSGEEALEAAGNAAPDVVVMDLNMPGIPGVEATRRLPRPPPVLAC